MRTPAAASAAETVPPRFVAADQRVQGHVHAQISEVKDLARRRAAEGVNVLERELHVRHGLGKAVEDDEVVPGGGAADAGGERHLRRCETLHRVVLRPAGAPSHSDAQFKPKRHGQASARRARLPESAAHDRRHGLLQLRRA
jgi:hypothetical protein